MLAQVARVERIGRATLYLGDNAAVREAFPAGAAIVTDPPYGINHRKGPGGAMARGSNRPARRNSRRIAGDAAPFDPSPWLGFAECILWGANHYAARLAAGRWLAFDKLAGLAPLDSFSDVEFAWMKGRGKDRVFSHLWKGVLRDSENTDRRFHPMQKPVALMRWCLGLLPDTAAPIIDPYMGAGSTGVAAVEAGRDFIGVELDPDYFAVACRRITAAQEQGDLFAALPLAPAQLPLEGL